MTITDTPITTDGSDDAMTWWQGIEHLTREYRLLPDLRQRRLVEMLTEIGQMKEDLSRLSDAADGMSICAACRGACCRAGRYHAAAIDILASLIVNEHPAEPDFSSGACPFLDTAGCRLAPDRRPLICITFICDLIADRLSEEGLASFEGLERRLRLLREDVEAEFGRGITRAFLFETARTARDGSGLIQLQRP